MEDIEKNPAEKARKTLKKYSGRNGKELVEQMKKEEFLRQLEQLLSGISEEEKADALAYYRSYFEDAGEENEDAIVAELESPGKVAESIRKNLGLEGNGSYYNSMAKRDAEYYRNVNHTIQNLQGQQKGNKGGWSALTITVLILTSPIWLTVLLAIICVLFTVVGVLLGVAIAVVAVMAAFVIVGFALAGGGFVAVFGGELVVGIGLIGTGLIMLALGLLMIVLTVWLFGGFLPWAFQGIAKLCKKPFEKRKENAL